MRRFFTKRTLIFLWLVWCASWFADGLCTFFPECVGLVRAVYVGERGMADMLVLMLSGFPTGTYVAIALGHFVVGENNLIYGFVGYILQSIAVIAIGYFQWFVLLPWLWRKWKSTRVKS